MKRMFLRVDMHLILDDFIINDYKSTCAVSHD